MPRLKMEAVSPKGVVGVDFLNSGRAQKKLREEFKKLAEKAKSEFEKSTQDWTNKPKFQIRGSWTEANIYTTDEVYGYVNNGTNAHYVTTPTVAVGGAMQFKTGYIPKTQVGNIHSNSGGGDGAFVYSKGHYVRGIKARRFDELVLKAVQDEVKSSSPNWFKDIL